MSLLTINPLASAQTPTQIATQDITQFNAIATLVHTRRTTGIAAVPAVIDQTGRVVQAPRTEVTPEQYVEGLVAAIGQEAYERLVAASDVLRGVNAQPA